MRNNVILNKWSEGTYFAGSLYKYPFPSSDHTIIRSGARKSPDNHRSPRGAITEHNTLKSPEIRTKYILDYKFKIRNDMTYQHHKSANIWYKQLEPSSGYTNNNACWLHSNNEFVYSHSRKVVQNIYFHFPRESTLLRNRLSLTLVLYRLFVGSAVKPNKL